MIAAFITVSVWMAGVVQTETETYLDGTVLYFSSATVVNFLVTL